MTLSKKSKRKKQRATSVPTPSTILFTFPAVRMLKDALSLVDEAFGRNTQPLPNLNLGKETLLSLQQKIDDILQGEDWDKEVPFDYNETRMLYAAVRMYLAHPLLAHNQQLTLTCRQLSRQFKAIIDAMAVRQLKAPGSD